MIIRTKLDVLISLPVVLLVLSKSGTVFTCYFPIVIKEWEMRSFFFLICLAN